MHPPHVSCARVTESCISNESCSAASYVLVLPMVCQWFAIGLPLVGKDWPSHVISTSIYSPYSSHRKSSWFYPEPHSNGDLRTSILHHWHCLRNGPQPQVGRSALGTAKMFATRRI